MTKNRTNRRWLGALLSAGALVVLTATGAHAAAPADETVRATGTVAPAAVSSGQGGSAPGEGFRGVQGWQLCLLSVCETSSGGDGAADGVQGVNFCLLALCSVRG